MTKHFLILLTKINLLPAVVFGFIGSGSTAKLRPFNHDFDCQPNVTELVLKSTSVVQDLTEELVGTAAVEFLPSSSKTKLQAKFTPVILQVIFYLNRSQMHFKLITFSCLD